MNLLIDSQFEYFHSRILSAQLAGAVEYTDCISAEK